MHRKIIRLFVAVLFILTCSMTVFAEDFDPQKTGSISVTLTEQYKKEPIVGAELSVYYVASVHRNVDGKLNYTYTDAFKKSGIDLADSSLATKLDAFVLENNIASIRITTDKNGKASCKDLALGLYFVRQVNAMEGFAPCTPFMVTVPGSNGDDYVYEVNASPKTEVAKLTSITIRKVWNTDASTPVTGHVTVQLLRNGNVVKTAVLNKRNNWYVTYTGMPESDAYSIREVDIPKGFKATYHKKGYLFTVTNTSTLAQTGQLIWPIPVLAVSGMLFITAGVILLQKKRKTNG